MDHDGGALARAGGGRRRRRGWCISRLFGGLCRWRTVRGWNFLEGNGGRECKRGMGHWTLRWTRPGVTVASEYQVDRVRVLGGFISKTGNRKNYFRTFSCIIIHNVNI